MRTDGLIDFCEYVTESQSQTIKALAEEFGGLTVYNRSKCFVPNDRHMKQAFDVLNMHVFGRKVDDIKLKGMTRSQIIADRKKDSYEFDEAIPDTVFALYSGLCDFKVDGKYVDDLSPYKGKLTLAQFSKIEVRLRFPAIYINLDHMKHSNFIFFVNSLCHEMIHRYDQLVGNLDYLMKKESMDRVKLNSHSTPTFIEMKEKARKERLKVIDQADGEDIDYGKLNDEAYDFMMDEADLSSKSLDVFKNAQGEWVVDMTQFEDGGHLKTVSKQYRAVTFLD